MKLLEMRHDEFMIKYSTQTFQDSNYAGYDPILMRQL